METVGEFFDNMDLMEILNNPNFRQLKLFKGIEGSPDYWEIMFESTKRTQDGYWLSAFNKIIQHKFYTFYKLK